MLNIIEESQAPLDDQAAQDRYLKNVKSALDDHKDVDARLAREKLTEMRLKKKRKNKERKGLGPLDDEE